LAGIPQRSVSPLRVYKLKTLQGKNIEKKGQGFAALWSRASVLAAAAAAADKIAGVLDGSTALVLHDEYRYQHPRTTATVHCHILA